MDRIEIRKARGTGIYMAIVGMSSILAGVFIFNLIGPFEFLAVLFGLFLLVGSLAQIFDRRPQIIFDEKGVSGKRTKGVVIPWQKISSVKRQKKWLFEFLNVEFQHDSGKGKVLREIRADGLDLPVLAIERIISRKAGLNVSRENNNDGPSVPGKE